MGTLWSKQDNQFLFPKAFINIDISNPVAYSAPHNANLTYMFSSVIMDQLEE